MASRNLWINDSAFAAEPSIDTWRSNRKSSVSRAYEYWQHAKELLEEAESSFQLADGIANLKRTINQRLKAIEQVYHLRSFELPGQPRHYLEILEGLGLVRPAILKYLIDVRNAIEHHDARPPSLKRCHELLDMTWYFLRSTDNVTAEFVNSVGFEAASLSFLVDITFGKRPVFKIAGLFPQQIVFQSGGSTRSRVIVKHQKENRETGPEGILQVWLAGTLKPTPMATRQILRAAFEIP